MTVEKKLEIAIRCLKWYSKQDHDVVYDTLWAWSREVKQVRYYVKEKAKACLHKIEGIK